MLNLHPYQLAYITIQILLFMLVIPPLLITTPHYTNLIIFSPIYISLPIPSDLILPDHLCKIKSSIMKIAKVLISSIIGTTAMTLFSSLISKSENKNLEQSENLAQLVNRLPINMSKKTAKVAGVCSHYGIGMGFVSLYDQLWKRHKVEPSVRSGALLGAVSGLIGVAAWNTMFKSHPNPQPKNLKMFMGQLVLSHVVFGVVSSIVYKISPDRKKLWSSNGSSIPVGDSNF